jgi:hypothetical protein
LIQDRAELVDDARQPVRVRQQACDPNALGFQSVARRLLAADVANHHGDDVVLDGNNDDVRPER